MTNSAIDYIIDGVQVPRVASWFGSIKSYDEPVEMVVLKMRYLRDFERFVRDALEEQWQAMKCRDERDALLTRVRELEDLLHNIHQNSDPQPTRAQVDWTLNIIHQLTGQVSSTAPAE